MKIHSVLPPCCSVSHQLSPSPQGFSQSNPASPSCSLPNLYTCQCMQPHRQQPLQAEDKGRSPGLAAHAGGQSTCQPTTCLHARCCACQVLRSAREAALPGVIAASERWPRAPAPRRQPPQRRCPQPPLRLRAGRRQLRRCPPRCQPAGQRGQGNDYLQHWHCEPAVLQRVKGRMPQSNSSNNGLSTSCPATAARQFRYQLIACANRSALFWPWL